MLDVIEYYVTCPDLSLPSEFIERYSSPPHVVLDSGQSTHSNLLGHNHLVLRFLLLFFLDIELVWPLPVRLFPYDD